MRATPRGALLALLPTAATAAAQNPVTFSVNGPVGAHSEGIAIPRGSFLPLPIPFAVRFPPFPAATGLFTLRPGDVFDYAGIPLPNEAVIFQSPPDLLLAFAPSPDGTNNQILEAVAMGLASGPGGIPAMALMPPRDNVDAFSFGEDYFPPFLMTGFDMSTGLPLPPVGPMGIFSPAYTPWEMRLSIYAEPIVADCGPVSFRFSGDPWMVGLPPTAVAAESGGFDVGAVIAYLSPGDAAGDVFGTPLLLRIAGATVAGGGNTLVHDNPFLGLSPNPPPLPIVEDDIDALECVGENTIPWFLPFPTSPPGDLHARVMDVPPFPGLAPPGIANHVPLNDAPVFFSVSRESTGLPFTAVRSQYVIDGSASADIFVAVTDPATGATTNLLFCDSYELGLVPGDDLDGLVLWVCPSYRATVSMAIDSILSMAMWIPYGFGDALTGPGMTISITKYIPPPPGCVRIGFSVTTDSVGMEYTAVDWEAGPVDLPFGGISSAAGDVFYVEPTGAGENMNYLWFEEVDLGLDPGVWVNGFSADFAELSDNLDGLDSIDLPACLGSAAAYGDGCPGTGGILPVLVVEDCPTGGGTVTVTVTSGLGGSFPILGLGAGPAAFPILGGCTLNIFPVLSLTPLPPLFGFGPGMGQTTVFFPIPLGTAGLVTAQAGLVEPTGGFAATNGVSVDIF